MLFLCGAGFRAEKFQLPPLQALSQAVGDGSKPTLVQELIPALAFSRECWLGLQSRCQDGLQQAQSPGELREGAAVQSINSSNPAVAACGKVGRSG